MELGKSTLLTELLINDTDVKHFDFCDIYKRHEHHPPLKHHYLCDENFDYFDFYLYLKKRWFLIV